MIYGLIQKYECFSNFLYKISQKTSSGQFFQSQTKFFEENY